MHDSPFNLKTILKTCLLSLFIIAITIYIQINDRRTKIVFCDVGQGDATYIRIKNRVDVLIDAGPDKKILSCLGKHVPFWDRKIELVFLSHHDKDHYVGFSYVVDRYQVGRFLTIEYRFDSQTYKKLEKKIENKKIPYQFVYKNDKISILDDTFSIYWPPIDLKSYDSNDYSLVFLFQENDFRVIFTGDSSSDVMNRLLDKSLRNVDILKIPHHGSKNGLTEKFLELADPKIAVISVGKNNSYGHPTKEILEILEARNIIIRRTDEDGDIVFKL